MVLTLIDEMLKHLDSQSAQLCPAAFGNLLSLG